MKPTPIALTLFLFLTACATPALEREALATDRVNLCAEHGPIPPHLLTPPFPQAAISLHSQLVALCEASTLRSSTLSALRAGNAQIPTLAANRNQALTQP